jgi:hypothetical protein
MVALEKFNKFLVHSESGLLSYSIDLLTRVALGQAPPEALEASQEKIAGQDGHILLFRTGRIGSRTLSETDRFRPHPHHAYEGAQLSTLKGISCKPIYTS